MKNCLLGTCLLICLLLTRSNAQEKMHVVIPQGHTNDIQHLLVTKDDQYMISAGYDRVVNFYDLKKKKLIKAFQLLTDSGTFQPTRLQFNAKQTKVLISCRYGAFILDIASLTLKSYYLDDNMMSVFSADEKTIYWMTRKEGYSLDVASGKISKLFTLEQKEELSNLRTSTTGRFLYFCSASQVWKYDTFTKKREVFSIPNLLEALPNGQLLALNLLDEYKNLYNIILYDQLTLKEVSRLEFNGISSKFKYILYQHWVAWDSWGWWAVDAKRNRIVLSNKGDAISYDYVQKKVALYPKYELPYVTSIALMNQSDQWLVGMGDAESPLDIRYYDPKANKMSDGILKGGFNIRYLSAAKHNNGFVCSPTISDDIKYFRVTESAKQAQMLTWGGAISAKDKSLSNIGETATLSPDGNLIAASNYYGKRMISEIKENLPRQAFNSGLIGAINTIDYSNNDLIAYFNYKAVLIHSIADKKMLKQIPTGGKIPALHGLKLGAISPDGKTVFTRYGTQEDKVDEHIAAYSVETSQKLWDYQLPDECTLLQLSADGKSLYAACKNDLFVLDPKSGKVNSARKFPARKGSEIMDISRDGSKVYTHTYEEGGWQQVFATADQKLIFTFPKTPVIDGIFLKNDSLMVTSNLEGLKIWDIYAKKELASIYIFKETASYLIMTPEGLFDGTDDAIKSIYFVEGKEVVPVESFYETYYTPNLLARLLSRQQLPVVRDVRNLHPRPVAKLNYAVKTRNLKVVDEKLPEYTNTTGLAEIAIEASAANDKIDEIRLFHNGKIVNIAQRNLLVTDDQSGKTRRTFTVNLLPGVNTFRGIALNSERTESAADELSVNYIGSASASVTPDVTPVAEGNIDKIDQRATLHLVVIGINAYQNPNMRLNYALADATSFKDQIQSSVRSVIKEVKTYFITDQNANKKGIIDAFEMVRKAARPEDVFIFYYAGHGVISEKNKEFYLVPNDVTDLKNVDEALIRNGIASKFLQQYAIDIKAQKQLFILDACQSAGAFASLMGNDATQQKSLALVARSTGTHWMAASGSQQFSQEFSQLGHGAFTYVLLSGLEGKAQKGDLITVNGLKNYIGKMVPEIMKQYHGSPQIPVSYGFGNDFPVGH